jgi:hypothetical protein
MANTLIKVKQVIVRPAPAPGPGTLGVPPAQSPVPAPSAPM